MTTAVKKKAPAVALKANPAKVAPSKSAPAKAAPVKAPITAKAAPVAAKAPMAAKASVTAKPRQALMMTACLQTARTVLFPTRKTKSCIGKASGA
jgi:hypothetical protein